MTNPDPSVERDPSCVFCRIVAGELRAEVVRETAHTMAFRDQAPQAPVHVLVVPRRHVPDIGTLAEADPGLAGALVAAAAAVAAQEGLTGGYRLVANTGPDAGQTVGHAHLHVMGGGHLRVLG